LLHEANAFLEQRIAERTTALREKEAIYLGIGESIDYGIWICAPDGRNTYASESFLNMVGITQEQCSDFGWRDALHPDDAERTIAAWQECVRTGGKWDIVHRFRGVDGQWHHVLARGIPIKNEQGDITSWAGINLDLTEMKRTEKALRESQKEQSLLANILENSSQPFAIGYLDGRIGLVNKAFEQLTGYTSEELREMDWATTLTPPEWHEIEHAKLEELNRTRKPARYEKEYVKKDGSRIPIELLVHLSADEDGQREYCYAFITDVSERKATELALKTINNELEKKNYELEKQNKLFIGRELRMMELKEQIAKLTESKSEKN
jgi:PAS domain S-box-containing protein